MLEIELSWWLIIGLVAAAFVAGYIDTLVGGGGLITIPALMMAGVPPLATLGTNKIQAVFGSGTASFMMFRLKKVRFSHVRDLMVLAFIGSLIGTVAVQFIDTAILEWLIPVVILLIAVYFLIAPQASIESKPARVSRARYAATAVPGIGVYDGMFGPATGSFFVLAGVAMRGQDIVSATARAKTLNFSTNLASVLVFAYYGQILFGVGLCMMVGQILGARMGSKALLSIEPSLLRVLVISMSCIMLVMWFFVQR